MRTREQELLGAEITLLSFTFVEDVGVPFMDVETSSRSCFRPPNPGVRPDCFREELLLLNVC